MNLNGRTLFASSFSVWIVAAIAGLYYLSPLVNPHAQTKPIRFGIDLVGGTYISLIVDTDKALEETLFERMQACKVDLKDARIPAPIKADSNQRVITLTFENLEDARQAADALRSSQPELKQDQQGNMIQLTLDKKEQDAMKKWAVESNIKVLQNRLDRFAVSEVTVAQQGEKNIIVELPNVDDPAKAKAMIGKAAMLEFKLVEAMGASQDELLERYDGDLPDDMLILPGKFRRGHEEERVHYLVPRHAEITGKLLRDSRPDFGEYGKPVVHFEFTAEGGKRFYELTSKNLGKPLAVVLDNEVISAPTINAAIRSSGIIEGNFTHDSAKELAELLKSGAYVAPVKFDEERTVGPSLGAQAIKQGTLACLIGLLLLLIFSIGYYKIPGLFAFITLLFNLLFLMVILGYFGGTLTLPGIAGLVLTLGMAIDSSILIYEKIKEELRAGVTLHRAVEAGFSGALVVILDANITTFIMGVVLYKFGTGPVQGFAVTMMIGIITTLLTGLFFLRSLFGVAFKGLNIQKMKF